MTSHRTLAAALVTLAALAALAAVALGAGGGEPPASRPEVRTVVVRSEKTAPAPSPTTSWRGDDHGGDDRGDDRDRHGHDDDRGDDHGRHGRGHD